MTNSLRKLAKDLKAFAKRCKDFKYTEQALFVFLLCGIVGFADITTAPTDKAIQNQRQEITTSIGDMRQQFKRVKSENDKLMKNYNLELIQLMEQGDHVVKSPWSSWQYGINTFYNDWHGTYKGKGDKVGDQKYARATNKFSYSANPQMAYGNTTELGLVKEPNAAIPVSASLTPITPDAKNANLSLNVDLSNLPAFKARTVEAPTLPNAPVLPTPGSFNFALAGQHGGNSAGVTAFEKNRSNGAIESVVSGKGTFKVTRNSDSTLVYKYDNYGGTSPWGTSTGDITTTSSSKTWSNKSGNGTTSSNRGLQKLVSGTGVTNTNNLITNTNNFNGIVREFVHMDHHGEQLPADARQGIEDGTSDSDTAEWDTTVSSNGSKKTVILKAFDDVRDNINETTKQGSKTNASSKMFTWINSGRIVMEGRNNVITNNYDHDSDGTTTPSKSSAINVGDILIQPYYDGSNFVEASNAVFSLSPGNGYNPGHHAIVYNGESGKINLWTPNSAYFINSETAGRAISIVNRGDVNLYGEKSVGTVFNNNAKVDLQFVSSDFTFNTGTNTVTSGSFKPITIYGDNSVGYYQHQTNTTTEGNFAVNIGASGVGNKEFSTNTSSLVTGGAETNGTAITNHSVNTTDVNTADPTYDSTLIRKSFGILSNSAMDLTSHQINIYDKTEKNVGVMPSANVLLNIGGGSITLDGGTTSKNNIGIYIGSIGGAVKSTGDVILNNGIGNVGVAAVGSALPTTGATNNIEVNKITTNTTKNAFGVYADNGAKVKVNELSMTGATVETDANTTNNKNTGAVFAKGGSTVDISRTTAPTTGTYNIDVTGQAFTDDTTKFTGFGLFATDSGTKINAAKNNIKVTNGASAVIATRGAEITLDGGTVHYDGSGYALYSQPGSKINLRNNGRLELAGHATGFLVDLTPGAASTVDLSTSTIDVQSNDVILANITGASTLSTTNLGTTLLGAAGNPTISSGSSAYTYKYGVVDGTTINIDTNIDKSDATTGSDSEVFTRRLLYQNSLLNATANVDAELNSSEISAIDTTLTVPVGLAVAASGNSSAASNKTGILINSGNTITAARTDLPTNGGIGLYADFASTNGIVNNGTVNVEQISTKNTTASSNAVGIYGTNSSAITNNGAVNVGGNNSIGLLGLSYRLDPTTGAVVDPKSESYWKLADSNAQKYGIVNVTNGANGTVTMDNDAAVGIYVKNNSLDKDASNNYIVSQPNDRRTVVSNTVANNNGTVNMNGGNNSVGMGAYFGILNNNAGATINVNNTLSAGMFGEESSVLNNAGTINVAATGVGTESVGMYTKDVNTDINTSGTINVGQNSFGIYGKDITMNGGLIAAGDGAVGIYSSGNTVQLNSGTITAANNKAVGVYIAADTPTTVNGNVNMTVGDNNSVGYLIANTTSTGATAASTNLTTASGTTANVGSKSIYIYTNANAGGTITNHTNIITTGTDGYGIYSSETANNYGDIDLYNNGLAGAGNIGIYSTSGTATNYGNINVGISNVGADKYGIGMATGYYNKTNGSVSNQGNIVNNGTIRVSTDNSIGMYAAGAGSTATNNGLIELDGAGNNMVGMYIDRGATGINSSTGVIRTTANATGTGLKGIVVANNSVFRNYGTINIVGASNMGIYDDNTSPASSITSGAGNVSTVPTYTGTATTSKRVGSVNIDTSGTAPVITLNRNGSIVPIALSTVDTDAFSPSATQIQVTDALGNNTYNFNKNTSDSEVTSLGMYVDTSGVNYTNPITGLHYLTGLRDINLIFGTEAADYTNAKAIQLGNDILGSYNNELYGVSTTGTTINVNSSSLTWLAQPVKSSTTGKVLDTVYLVKIPYTDFASAKDRDTSNFLDGLEQRYDANAINSREKQVFNKLNSIGKGETHIFTQAVNEMKGYQYSNTQHRINETGSLLDKEFRYLHDEWRNPSKDNNKIKVFGMRNEYNTDTAGVIDYNSKAYGVAYVHEDETVKLGNSSGWYAGAINNRFEFKDLGKSRENQTMVKAGIFKTMSPYNDHNGSLRWTIAGDVFAGQNEMKRRYWIVDDTFSAKGDYTSYGAALKTDLGYDIRMSERTHLRPYGALKMEYGRFNDIKEDSGEVRLEVNGNDYFSVKPEVGVEFKYVQPMAVRTQLSVGLSAAYENELGKINKLNQARVRYTTADWYNLRNEKEDRRGNGKFDFNLGVDNTRFGVTVNAGYDTKGSNIRGGIGFRTIY